MNLKEAIAKAKKDEAVDVHGMEHPAFKSNLPDFFVVTTKTPGSTLGDILFEANPISIMLNAKGGLDPREILRIEVNKQKAESFAKEVLASDNPSYMRKN